MRQDWSVKKVRRLVLLSVGVEGGEILFQLDFNKSFDELLSENKVVFCGVGSFWCVGVEETSVMCLK